MTVAMRCAHPCSLATYSQVSRIAISRAWTGVVNTVWRRPHKRWLHCNLPPVRVHRVGPEDCDREGSARVGGVLGVHHPINKI